ncbi:MAG: hypothetical protein H0U49_03390 [Parachlamydiaceae bacterium]|nr:hypothetical protein [Parachlamydiaceae bacterium]
MAGTIEKYGVRDQVVEPCSTWVIRQQEKQLEDLIGRLNSEAATIELIIAHQRSLGNNILTIDNVTSRKISNIVTEFSQMKQDTFTSTDKRVWQWASVFFNVVGGCCAIGSIKFDFLKTCFEAGSGFAKGSDTIAQITDADLQKAHTRYDYENQQGRTQKDALMQSENRMKGSNDSVTNILAKYYEALYQLRIALARMT